jgi:hypothetical protein
MPFVFSDVEYCDMYFYMVFAMAEQIRSNPRNIASAIKSLLIRAENCLANGGGHFEQLL